MENDKVIEVLKSISQTLNKNDIMWALTGSLSFKLQGIDVSVNDIDIQTDKEGAYKIQDLYKEYVVKPIELSSTDTIKSYFGKILLNGITVEIMGDIQKRDDLMKWAQPTDLEKLKG